MELAFETNKSVIVFDFDGVLIESNRVKKQEFFNIWHGEVSLELIVNIVEKSLDRFETITEIYNQCELPMKKKYSINYYVEAYSERVERSMMEIGLKNGVKKLLEESNKILVINSATPNIYLNKILQKLNIFHCFKYILGGDSSKSNNFFFLKSELSMEFDDMIFIGDMQSDKDVADSLGVEFMPIYSIETNLLR